jgi:hypothetical protein
MSRHKNPEFFFILGRPRSGTSLLMSILDAHPSTLIPVEIPIISDLYPTYGKCRVWDEKQKQRFLDDLKNESFYHYYRIEDLPFDFATIEKQLNALAIHSDFSDVIKVVYSNYQSWFPKAEITHLGDKNPSASKEVKNYLKAFPKAKFIHITRDYRDHTLSMLNAGFGIQNPAVICYRWRKNLEIINHLKKKYPKQFFPLRYEDLVQHPEKEVQEICAFLGLDYQADMLRFYEQKTSKNIYPKHLMDLYQKSLLHPIATKNCGVWKNNMTLKDIRMCDAMVGRYAEKQGYARQFKSFYVKAFLYKTLISIRRGSLKMFGLLVRVLPLQARLKIKYRTSLWK